jgi:hypothetical protein
LAWINRGFRTYRFGFSRVAISYSAIHWLSIVQ